MKIATMAALMFVASYVAGSSVPDANAVRTTEDQWREQAIAVEREARADGMIIGIEMAEGNGNPQTPALTRFYVHSVDGRKICLITIIDKNNPYATKMFGATPRKSIELVMKSILQHEIGHCAMYVNDLERLIDEKNLLKEAYADVYSIAKMSTLSDAEFKEVIKFFKRLRDEANNKPLTDDPKVLEMFEKYNTMRFIAKADKIRELAKTYSAAEVAAHIVYGDALPEK